MGLVVGLLMLAIGMVATTGQKPSAPRLPPFDHDYGRYADLLHRHVVGTRVDYRGLARTQPQLDRIVERLGLVSTSQLTTWTRDQRLAYWVNAYNVFTLQAIIRHYPIQNRWFTVFGIVPPNSIKQIPGVWNRLSWPAAGTERTLDDIEHGVIRPDYDEPLIHFAVNCAAVSCPPLRSEPYVSVRLGHQLAQAARDFLNSQHGLQIDGSALRVSGIFNWYGEDFVARYADRGPSNGEATERGILGVVATYGPPKASRLALSGEAKIGFLDYDWGLNDVGRR